MGEPPSVIKILERDILRKPVPLFLVYLDLKTAEKAAGPAPSVPGSLTDVVDCPGKVGIEERPVRDVSRLPEDPLHDSLLLFRDLVRVDLKDGAVLAFPDTLTEGNKAPFDQDAVMRLYIFGNSYPAENGYIYSVHVIPADKQRESGIPIMIPSRTQHLSGGDDFVTCYRHNISPSISCAAARAALLTYRDYGAGRSKLRTSKKISPRKGKKLFA